MAEGEKAGEDAPSPGKAVTATSLEILLGSALAGVASLLKDPGQRALATAMAPPIGYVIVGMGRRLVDIWIPRWSTPKIQPPETPESRARGYIDDARKALRSGTLSQEEFNNKAKHILALEDALQKKLLDDLQVIPAIVVPINSPHKDVSEPD